MNAHVHACGGASFNCFPEGTVTRARAALVNETYPAIFSRTAEGNFILAPRLEKSTRVSFDPRASVCRALPIEFAGN